jgi:ABC-2 type transport system permease protein
VSGSIIFLVARRELVTRVRTRSFLIGTALIIVLLAGYVLFQMQVVGRAGDRTTTVGFTGPADALASPLQAAAPAFGLAIDVRHVAGEADGERQVRDGGLDVLVSGAAGSPDVLVQGQLQPALRAALDGILRREALDAQLRAAGLDPPAVEARAAGASIHTRTVRPVDPERPQKLIFGLFASGILYVALLLYGTFVAQGVVEEKATRVVEILLSTIRPFHLLVGKVAGIGLVGLLQLAIVGSIGLGLSLATHTLTVPALGVGAVASGLLWFVLGYFTYALLYAAAGSLVSRQEEVQSATMPVTMLLVVTFVLSVGLLTADLASPGGTSPVTAALSVLPAFSPIMMPARMATGDAPAWQALLAVALDLAAAAGLAWLTARIYANSVLRTGARTRLREALRGA